MKRALSGYLVVVAAVALGGCVAQPLNERHAAFYYEAGDQTEQRGDLETARRNYGKALVNARLANVGPAKEAYPTYELARVTGYLRHHAEAEQLFNEALALIDKANRDPLAEKLRPPALCELARLLHDTGRHVEAVPVYERAVRELDRVGAEQGDPAGMAVFLDEYAASLRAAGQSPRADDIARRAAAIRAAHPGEKPRFEPRRYTTGA